VINKGPGEVHHPKLVIDTKELDLTRVSLTPLEECDELPEADTVSCPLGIDTLQVGQKAVWSAKLKSVDIATTGVAGTLSVHAEFDGGESAYQHFLLNVEGDGPDLAISAMDVPLEPTENGDIVTGDLAPGETGLFVAGFANFGTTPAGELKVTTTVPQGASFDQAVVARDPEDFEGCVFTGRTAVCDFGDLVLMPPSQETDTIPSQWLIGLPVKVDANAKSGVNLTGGVAEVAGKPVAAPVLQLVRKAAAKAPKGMLADEPKASVEIDDNDNSDSFAVIVANADGNGGGDGGGGTGGGGLPVTGPVAASIGTAGALVIAVGVMLFVVARRRRVVLVTPRDERPSSHE
jgi:hypothetical protein